MIACKATGRTGVGIELVPQWIDISKRRVHGVDLPLFQNIQLGDVERSDQEIIEGDARIVLKSYNDESFDFIVTSPPYWKILHKDKDHKVTRERTEKGLEAKYSELESDLGNIKSYSEFLSELQRVFTECYRVQKTGKYMCVIVSDFRDKGEFILYHTHISYIVKKCGYKLQGITILVQDNKNLYPYGIPYAFVSNINHQYILIFQKKNK